MNTIFAVSQPARARVRGVLAALVLLLALVAPMGVALAQDDEGDDPLIGLAEMPTTGAARPGPMTPVPSAASPVIERGTPPVAIVIEKAAVDAPVERREIDDDGVMQDPTGPWVVSWYEDLAALGEGGNVVMAGHIDYWNVGPAVFYGLPSLVPGDLIQVFGEDGEVYEYEVEWLENYDVATELTPEVIQEEIVGGTDEESLTLITCGGPFNYDTGEYLERMVVRAVHV